jgi:hypothetical protein
MPYDYCPVPECPEKTIKVLDFSLDNDHEMDSEWEYTHASLRNPMLNLPPAFTICSAFMVEAWTTEFQKAFMFQLNGVNGVSWGYVRLWAAETYTQFYIGIGTDYTGSAAGTAAGREEITATDTAPVMFPLQWTRACLSLDPGLWQDPPASHWTPGSGRIRLVVDGTVLEDGIHDGVTYEDIYRPSELSLILGHESDTKTEYAGRISDLNVFSTPLPTDQMVLLTNASRKECGASGDLLSWAEAEWELHSMARSYTIPDSEGPCRVQSDLQSDLHVYTADFEYHTDCMEHCEKIGDGRSPPVRNLTEWETLNKKLRQISNIPYSARLWLSATDETVEGEWRDAYTQEELGYYTKPWYSKYAMDNGGLFKTWKTDTSRNCLSMRMNAPSEYSWEELECYSYDMSCPCQYERPPLLTLRGLCADHYKLLILDSLYTPRQLPWNPSDLFLLGHTTTQMHYNDSSSRWVLTDASVGVTGESEATKLSYLLGKHWWTIRDDTLCNKTMQEKLTGFNVTTGQYIYNTFHSYTTQLKLTGCSDGEFTCDDGQCITMAERCDQVEDCRGEHKSDEVNCQLIVLKPSYNKLVPPITTVSTTNKTIVPVHVNISINLHKIVSMVEAEHKIELQFTIQFQWNESERAIYHNLKNDSSLNTLTNDDISKIWLPLITYANTDQRGVTKRDGEWITTVTVSREGNFNRSKLDEADEIEIFRGSENTLTMTQSYTWEFQCHYRLANYPFDTQVSWPRIYIG